MFRQHQLASSCEGRTCTLWGGWSGVYKNLDRQCTKSISGQQEFSSLVQVHPVHPRAAGPGSQHIRRGCAPVPRAALAPVCQCHSAPGRKVRAASVSAGSEGCTVCVLQPEKILADLWGSLIATWDRSGVGWGLFHKLRNLSSVA